MEQEKGYVIETLRECTYLGYRVRTGGGCEAAATAKW